jgi:hypothetical protein
MRPKGRSGSAVALAVLGVLAIGGGLIAAAPPAPAKEAKERQAAPGPMIPLKLGRSIPVSVQSAGVAWEGRTWSLVGFRAIRFELDKQTNHLKADVRGGVTHFDNVDYDVSVAVFDAAGKLLGVARTACEVRRYWVGGVISGPETLELDFGVSLDYTRAAAFMISISNRKVLTPDQWQK